jgi:hypothetical protein
VIFYILIVSGFTSYRDSAFVGLLVGVASYIRGTSFLTFLLAFVAFIQKRISLKKAIIHSTIILVLTMLVLTPNGIRNKRKFGDFRFLYIFSGKSLWVGNNPAVSLSGSLAGEYIELPLPEHFPVGSFDRDALRRDFSHWYTEEEGQGPVSTVEAGRLTRAQLDDLYKRYAVQYIKTHKMKTWSLVPIRFWNLYQKEDHGLSAVRLGLPADAGKMQWGTFRFFERITPLYYWTVLLFMLAFLIFSCRDPKGFIKSPTFLPLLIIAFNTLPFLVIHAVCRFHFHFVPLFVIYSAAAIDAVIGKYRD